MTTPDKSLAACPSVRCWSAVSGEASRLTGRGDILRVACDMGCSVLQVRGVGLFAQAGASFTSYAHKY